MKQMPAVPSGRYTRGHSPLRLLLAAAGRVLLLFALALLAAILPMPLSAQFSRGVNMAGPEFADDLIPGQLGENYTFNTEASFAYYAAKGFNLVRVPIRWERIQPVLNGPLEPLNLQGLKQDIAWAKAHGLSVIIDLHNYGRYKITENGKLQTYIIDNSYDGEVKVPRQTLADLWVRLSQEFRNEPTVYAYGIMNEPHDMGSANWKGISQTVLSAIRDSGDRKKILIAGDGWSSAERWEEFHGAVSWITDPAGNFVYEAHQYFDSDASGTYERSYDAELSDHPNLPMLGVQRLAPFIAWCQRNQVRGFLGEFSIPDSDPRWLTVLENFMASLDQAGFDATYWAAGEWWRNYALSVQPEDNFQKDRPQMAVLLRHLGVAPEPPLDSNPAASLSGDIVAPGSLATARGFGLTLDVAKGQPPLPTELAGLHVTVTDSLGREQLAPLLFVSPNQINYLVPEALTFGALSVAAWRGDQLVGRGKLQLQRLAPGLFSANGDGQGVAAAQLLRVHADGTMETEPVVRFNAATTSYVPVPIRFSGSDQLYLELYGTGFGLATLAEATLRLGDVDVPLLFVGPQGSFTGLDQINARLPQELAGYGTLDVHFAVAGQMANVVTITVD